MHLTKTYSTNGNFTAYFESCCRITGGATGLQNNADGNERTETIVNVGTGNASPVTSVAPIVQVPDNQIWTFQIPALDPDSDALTYRLATSAEAAGALPFVHPGNFSISNTGLITWDIRNSGGLATIPGNLWSTQIIVEDHSGGINGPIKSKIPVDFLLRIGQAAANNNPPTVSASPAGPFQPVAGQTLTFNVTAVDTDGTITGLQALNAPSGMTFSAFGSPAASKTITATWTPTQAQAGQTIVVTFQATDNGNATANTAVTISPAANQPPVATNDSYSVNEDSTLTVVAPGVLTNDTDPESNPFTVAAFTQPANGTLTLNANGSFTYIPNGNFFGTDTFTYSAKDSIGTGNTATVTITVNPVNDPPVANNDTATTNEDIAVAISVLANDLAGPPNESGQTLTPSIVTPPTHGLAVVNANGTITYTPAGDYNGTDSFVYRVSDGSLFSGNATVNITIDAVNDAPVANDDLAITNEDTPVGIAVLANDLAGPANESSQTLTVTHLNGIPVNAGTTVATAHGTVTLNADGTVTYAPAPNYHGGDSFTYTIKDSGAPPLTDSANGSVTINSVNDAPNAVNDSYTTAEDTPLTIAASGILANDTDIDVGTTLSVATPRPISMPTHGLLTLNANGSFTYIPFTNYNGTDSFTYKASDGIADSNLATVTITITSVNDAPVATDDGAITNEDTAVTIPILGNDMDVDGTLNPATVTITLQPAHGSLSINATTGDVTYTPILNYNGPDCFKYTIKDNDGAVSNEATVKIIINPVNDTPIAVNDSYTTAEDVVLTVAAPGVKANDSDVDGDPLSAFLVTPPTHGGVILNANGSFIYTPDTNYTGPDSFTYYVNDGAANSNLATVNITVTPVNDAPLLAVDHHHAADQSHSSVDEGEIAYNHGTWGEVDVGDTVTLSASLGTVTKNVNGTWNWSYQTTDGPLPVETEVVITATDQSGASTSRSFHLEVNNVAPTVTLFGAASANEGQTICYNFTTVDPGQDTFSIVSITAGTNTVISNLLFNSATGIGSFDVKFLEGPSVATPVSVQLMDSDSANSNISSINVTVANLPPTPSNDNNTPAANEVLENAANGTLAGITAVSTDPGVLDTITYSLTNSAGGRFAIHPSTGVVTVANGALLDYEADTSHVITVKASDGQGGESLQSFTINLLNVTARISGTVFVDVDNDGLFDGGTETGIDGVTVQLLNSTGATVLATDVTAMGGAYAFTVNDEFGTYRIREIQPTGVTNGAAILGSAAIDSVISANEMQLTLAGENASDYDFTELGSSVHAGDTATIGFWQNKNGQALINQGGAALVNWLNANFGNIFGDTFRNGSGGDNAAEVASFYKNEFFTKKIQGTSKVDAQFMATAFAVFFTSSSLSGGNVAASYGFNVTATGIGTRVVNVGSSGAAFSVANNTNMTIMALLLATNNLTGPSNNGSYRNVYDVDGNGVLDAAELALRSLANTIYTNINEEGDI